MIVNKFCPRLKEASCVLEQTEPYTPWSNIAERTIKELKKGEDQKFTKTKT